MEVLNDIFLSSNSATHSLNYSSSKTLQVILQSVYPIVKVVLELRAVQHQESVFFSIKTWRKLNQYANVIYSAMRKEEEKIVFVNDELKVFTECMHDQCAVCFLDITGKRVNIMLKTFKKMMDLEYTIIGEYKRKIEMLRKTAKNLTKFADFILTQCNNTRLCNEVKEHLEMLSNYTELEITINSTSNLSYMYDTEIEDCESDEENESGYCDQCGRSDCW